MKRDFIIILISVSLYTLNNLFKGSYHQELIQMIMNGYFNDIVGSIAFMAYCNILLSTQKTRINKLSTIIIIMIACGFVWEFLGPLIRHDTYTDLLDFVAYVLGGTIYYYIKEG